MFDYEYWGNGVFNSYTNMALEEFLLKRCAITNTAAIRFYSFPRDSIILGYAQDTDAIKKTDNTFDIARRATGGSHVQVGSNIVAYTFVVPRDGSFKNYEDMRAYYAQHVADALEEMGIENIDVDNRASTVTVDNKVVASHAIIWGVKSALLHGLIILDPYNVDKINQRVFLKERKIGAKTYSEYSALKNIPAVSTLLSNVAPNLNGEARLGVMKEMIANKILDRVAGDNKKNQILNKKTFAEAINIVKEKYGTAFWIKARKPPFTEKHIEEIPGEELNGSLKKKLGYCLFIQVKDKDFKKMSEPLE